MNKKTAEGKYLKDDASNYDPDAYKKPSVTVDICICTIIDGDFKVLLIKRKHPPFKGDWAIPGGFVNPDDEETLEETAIRELQEETGLKDIYIEQLRTYGDPGRDPRMRIVTVVYFALVAHSLFESQIIKADDDACDVGWFSMMRLPKLGFDHDIILNDLLIRLRGKISYTDIAFSLLPPKFTWAELQRVYEIILGRSLLAPNFRRKIRSMYNLSVFAPKKTKKAGRPPVHLEYVNMKEQL